MSLHEQGRYRLGPPPLIGHIATCQNCDWQSKPRGKVETAARDFEQHQRAARPMPSFADGECSMCGERDEQCVQFFAQMGYVRLCRDCIKRLHHRNIDIAKAERHGRYIERTQYGQSAS